MNFGIVKGMHRVLFLLSAAIIVLPMSAQQSWVYECRYLCSEECRGKMFIEGVDVKCACDDCQPMISVFEGERLTAIYAGRRAMEEAHKAGKFFYHYSDELNDFIINYWPNDGYQITRVEYHKLPDRRYVKYFLTSLSGRNTAVAFMTDARDYHYRIRCQTGCDNGPLLEDVAKRAQEYCNGKKCRLKTENIRFQQF